MRKKLTIELEESTIEELRRLAVAKGHVAQRGLLASQEQGAIGRLIEDWARQRQPKASVTKSKPAEPQINLASYSRITASRMAGLLSEYVEHVQEQAGAIPGAKDAVRRCVSTMRNYVEGKASKAELLSVANSAESLQRAIDSLIEQEAKQLKSKEKQLLAPLYGPDDAERVRRAYRTSQALAASVSACNFALEANFTPGQLQASNAKVNPYIAKTIDACRKASANAAIEADYQQRVLTASK
jgi:hypothetical protein